MFEYFGMFPTISCYFFLTKMYPVIISEKDKTKILKIFSR